jgi:cutinase
MDHKMKVFSTLATIAALANLVAAAPAVQVQGDAANLCDIGFVFARGSTEPPPLGLIIGPGLELGLKTQFPLMKTFPVLYPALLVTNLSPERTDPASILEGAAAFEDAELHGCKKIIAAGYSQGAAVITNVISKVLDEKLKEKIVGVALFGDTLNAQTMGNATTFTARIGHTNTF